MTSSHPGISRTELDRVNFPELRDRVIAFEREEMISDPRSYPGYPTWRLARVRPRRWTSLDRTLAARRSQQKLGNEFPSHARLSRLLYFAHGVNAARGRGPVPSAGGLQALELYLVNFTPCWLPAGLYHYDRARHSLTQIAPGADRQAWQTRVPSLTWVNGGAFLWIVVGDGGRVATKYGERGGRFLLLEAGHLVQNLCVLSQSLGLATVPLGAAFEREIARALVLPENDLVLYEAVCGRPET